MLYMIPQDYIESLREQIRELEIEVNSEGTQQLKEKNKVHTKILKLKCITVWYLKLMS